ncbi:MAG: hypothetical protein CMM58_11060 [Rhodospirillaceae bacterium]|nr:hypothetical protein [Rhodospirillaceae bacterium]|tara:strand:- start:129 stop:593 length:465 start_codon:yes stop_codon:yes gene_type:complete
MLSALRSLLKTDIKQENASATADQAARLACAALLARAAWLDGSLDESEEKALIDLIMLRFCLNVKEAGQLLREAADDLETSNDIYRYTKVLRSNFNMDERLKLIEMVWEVVYADGKLNEFEATLMRRLAGLLYIEDRDSGDARKRVLQKLGLED